MRCRLSRTWYILWNHDTETYHHHLWGPQIQISLRSMTVLMNEIKKYKIMYCFIFKWLWISYYHQQLHLLQIQLYSPIKTPTISLTKTFFSWINESALKIIREMKQLIWISERYAVSLSYCAELVINTQMLLKNSKHFLLSLFLRS